MRQTSKLLILFIALLSIVSLALTGCGGGGGGGGAPSQPPSPRPAKQSTTVSGSVLGLSSLVSSVSSKSSTSQEKEVPLPNAIVEIVAYDKDGKETGRATTTTLSTGTFNAKLDLSTGGGYVVITVKREGFADYSKRIDFEKPSDINLRAVLEQVATAIASRSDAVFTASTGEKVIKFGLFKTAKGQKVVKVGKDVEIRKQQGEQPTLEITIPADSIPSDVNTLVAKLRTFDPVPVNDANKFPGQYRDKKGNTLVSLGFDYINITDDRGQNLGALTTQAIRQGKLKKAQTSPTIIKRWINSNSCNNLLKDYCTGRTTDDPLCNNLIQDDKNGFNLPIYTYDPYTGLWEMLGIGTLLDTNDNVLNLTDYNGDGTINEKDYQKWCSDNYGAYTRILVSNENFIANYWNLDYPLIFEQPKEIGVVVTFKDSDGNPIEGLLTYLYDDDSTSSFSSAWGSTDSDGKVKLSTVLTSSSDTDGSAMIGFTNPFDWSWQNEPVTLGEAPNFTQKTITIQKPKMCKVEGYVKDEQNNGVANQYVYAYFYAYNENTGSYSYDYRYAYTDSNGKFSMDVRCSTDYNLYTGWSLEVSRVFNVNKTLDNNESSDDGDKVTLKDIVLQNQAPYVYGWLSSTSIYTGNQITAYIYGWDNECDTPMNWEIKGAPSSVTGTASDCWFYEEESITFSSPGTYDLTLSVRDSKGKTGTAYLGTVYVVQEGNRRPVIQYAYPDRYSTGKNTTVNLYGGAYDFDANNLSWKWYAKKWNEDNYSEISGCSGSGSSSISTTCSYTTPNADGTVDIMFEVSDGTERVSQTFTISVGSTGSVDIIIQKRK
jgi:hypothetical protein